MVGSVIDLVKSAIWRNRHAIYWLWAHRQGPTIAVLICLSYSIVAVNTIAIAKTKYLPTFVSSLAFMIVNFFLIKHIAEAKSTEEFIGYCVGGVGGDFLGIWIAKKFNI